MWEVDLVDPTLGVGAYLRTASYPNLGRTACWAALVGDGRPLVTVVEHAAPALRAGGLDLRAEGLWADQICETPLEHWTVGLEAFGVALDDPAEAFSGCRGDVTALGLDVEWESEAADLVAVDGGYELPCRVSGEVLVGAERLEVDDAWGRRRHTWGAGGSATGSGGRVWGRLGDGTPFAVPATVPLVGGMPGPLAAVIGGAAAEVVPRHHAPVGLPDGGRVHRSMASVVVAGGPAGTAWVELAERPAGT